MPTSAKPSKTATTTSAQTIAHTGSQMSRKLLRARWHPKWRAIVAPQCCL
jgi:hypothetical protein